LAVRIDGWVFTSNGSMISWFLSLSKIQIVFFAKKLTSGKRNEKAKERLTPFSIRS
jgi:hypothetical protein